jgi:hypothetical protein
MVGKQTYFHHKNTALFNHLFRGETDDYAVWINSDKSGSKKTVDNKVYQQSNNTDQQSILTDQQQEYDNIEANVITNKRGRKRVTYEADTELYKKVFDGFISKYEKLNKGQHEDLKIDFGLHFDKRGDYSGRSKSYFCLTLNEKKEHKSDNTMEKRSDFLRRVRLADYKEIYDIKSEVPRTTILANTGVWESDSYDIYEEVIKLSGVEDINRDVVKDLSMRFNFGTGTLKARYNYYRNSRIKELIKELKKENEIKSYKDAERLFYIRAQDIYGKYKIPNQMRDGTTLEYTFEEWVALGEAVEKIRGKAWGNIIFWWTSLIQVQTLYTVLEEKNIRIYNVYDSFYGPSSITKEYIKDVIKRSALFVYENYIKEVAEKRAKNNAVHNGGGSGSSKSSSGSSNSDSVIQG